MILSKEVELVLRVSALRGGRSHYFCRRVKLAYETFSKKSQWLKQRLPILLL